MKENIYLDMYSLPSIDYHESIGRGLPFEVEELNRIHEEVYYLLSSLDMNEVQNDVLSILKPFLIKNLSNFVRLHLIAKRLSTNYNLVFTNKDEFKRLAGERSLGQSYIADFFSENDYPIIKSFLKGFYYNKKKAFAQRILSVFPKKNEVVIFNENKWVKEYLKKNDIKHTKIFNAFFWAKENEPNVIKDYKTCQDVTEMVYVISNLITDKFDLTDTNEINKINGVLNFIIKQGYTDYINCKSFLEKKELFFNEIYSGTCGSYLTRIVFTVLKKKGIITNGFMHSGSISHIDNEFEPRLYIEYEVPDNFYVFDQRDIPIIQEKLNEFNVKTNLKAMKINSKQKSILDKPIKSSERKRRKVLYVGSSSSAGFQAYGLDDDTRKSSYENRLFETLQKHNCEIKYKTHPKGARKNYSLLMNKFPAIEIIDNKSMSEVIEEDDDIFIFSFVDSTAFNECMRSNKPGIVISEHEEKKLTIEAKDALKNRISFVDVSYSNGLAVINETQLEEALSREYVMDFEFVNRFQ